MRYYRKKLSAYPVFEWLEIGALLCAAGGFLDAYTFVTRGGVFCNAQTSNLIFLTLGLASGDATAAMRYLVPVLLFIVGVFLSELCLHLAKKKRGEFRGHGYVLAGEIAVLIAVGFLPASVPDMLVNALVSLAAAVQFDNFRTMEDKPFATAFCTGNMRSATEHAAHSVAERDAGALRVTAKYALLILAFLCGVLAGYYASRALGGYAALIAAAVLMAVLVCIFAGESLRRRVRVRRIATEELPVARALILESFEQNVAPSFSPEGVERFRAFLSDESLAAHRACFGIFASGILKGVLIAEKDGSHICAFFVKNGEQRKGYGSTLMSHFLQDVCVNSVTVNAAPNAVNAYIKMGFHAESDMQYRDGMAFVPMRYEKNKTGGTI